MLHAFFEPGDWFAPKRFGYGAGLPIAWQGWVLTLAYAGAVVGLALLLDRRGDAGRMIASCAGLAGLTALFLTIVARRTRGGFRWRWGGAD